MNSEKTQQSFTGESFTVTNIRDYKNIVPHAVNTEPERVQVWYEGTDVWDYEQLDMTVSSEQSLIHEQNITTGQGRYIAILNDTLNELLEESILEPSFEQ